MRCCFLIVQMVECDASHWDVNYLREGSVSVCMCVHAGAGTSCGAGWCWFRSLWTIYVEFAHSLDILNIRGKVFSKNHRSGSRQHEDAGRSQRKLLPRENRVKDGPLDTSTDGNLQKSPESRTCSGDREIKRIKGKPWNRVTGNLRERLFKEGKW